jgi:CDP-diacylglycerol--glycerol-3-phosphate 3-phosphatidyltransferase
VAEQLAGEPTTAVPHRVWTVPNALSMLRLVGVPVFLYLVLGPHRDGLAILLLMASGVTDYLDGQIARRFGSYSRLGQLLDPLADRLYILATLVGLVLRDGIPWWWAAVLIGRDALLGVTTLPYLRKHGFGPLPVHFLGKAATFNLLFAFPMLLAALPEDRGLLADVFRPLGWAFVSWGTALYLWAGVLYVVQVRAVVAQARREQLTGASVTPASPA